MKKKKKNDLKILVLITMLTALAMILFKGEFLISTLLFFGLPSLYLISRHPKAVKKSAIFSIIFSTPLTLILDYLISLDQGWHITKTVFSFKIFNIVSLEQFIWSFLWVFYIVMFYEYFFDKKEKISLLSLFFKKKKSINKKMKYFSLGLFLVLLAFIFTVVLNPGLLKIDYSYLILSIIFCLIPLSIFLLKFPNFFSRFAKVSIYFIFLAVLVEHVGLKMNHWTFPGNHFLGKTNFFGSMIPYEEIIFYFILSTSAVLSYYEFFDDDLR